MVNSWTYILQKAQRIFFGPKAQDNIFSYISIWPDQVAQYFFNVFPGNKNIGKALTVETV